MKKPSILFIEPSGNKTSVFDNYMRLPLLGSLYLATILHDNGYDVKILNENILKRKIDPFEIKADIFCITALTVSANRAKILAGQFKKLYPESRVLVGGIHASLLADEFTSVADQVIIGEAEDIILDVIDGKFEEKVVHGTKIQDMDKLPLINYSLLEGFETIDLIPLMTSRGCPFDCSFCTVTKIFGKQFRMQSPERIVAEIKNVMSFSKYTDFFFYDDNFTANKKRINDFCDLILKEDININWSVQARADLSKDPELVKKMVNAGFNWVFIGFESINDETLKAYHKSQTKEDIKNAIKVLHDFGVKIHGMFMFGEDHDNVDNIHKTVQFAIDNNIDTVQFMILTPFPGTQIFELLESQKRIFHKNWDYYNAMFAVFQPKQMSPVKLVNETYRAYKRFYSIRRTLIETLCVSYNVLIDAFVWNFYRVKRNSIDTMLLRAGAQIIIIKYGSVYSGYLKYLEKIEQNQYKDT